MLHPNRSPLASLLAAFLFAMLGLAGTAQAQMSYTGTVGGGAVSGSGVLSGGTMSFGTLALPADINFGDILAPNPGSTAVAYTDTWNFSFSQAASGGGSVTGDALWLKNFTLTGIIDNVTVRDVTTNATIFTTTLPNALATGFYVGMATPGDLYALSITSSVPAGAAVASYTGVFLAQAVPEPGAWLLMAAGLAVLATGLRSRRR
jgi:hypothetical protein